MQENAEDVRQFQVANLSNRTLVSIHYIREETLRDP